MYIYIQIINSMPKINNLFLFVQVAIKYIKKSKIADDQDLNRIYREIHIMSRLNHPHIVNVREGELLLSGYE